jgi:hypothetical protein
MEARDLATTQLQAVRARLAELQALEASLAGFVERCDTDCAGGTVADCTIIEDLGTAASREGRAAVPGTCCASAQSPRGGRT